MTAGCVGLQSGTCCLNKSYKWLFGASAYIYPSCGYTNKTLGINGTYKANTNGTNNNVTTDLIVKYDCILDSVDSWGTLSVKSTASTILSIVAFALMMFN